MIKMCIVCIAAGLASGVGVGFVGMSAATVLSSMLIAFLGCPWYEAVGIGLMADVPAAAIAARTYKKHGYVDLKNGRFMLAAVLVMVIIGSYLSQYMPDTEMRLFSVVMTLFMGAKFVLQPGGSDSRRSFLREGQRGKILSLLVGAYIGLYCGFVGLGGGLMMLFVLNVILGYELKMAVGTSVFVMTFTAFIGAVSHFAFGDVTGYIIPMIICTIVTFICSAVSSSIANRISAERAHRITGVVLLILGTIMIVAEWENVVSTFHLVMKMLGA
ncbi:MAG TPA: sulfite exporter TauE/SafE family protein [Candidatus Anaerobutyricum stercoris]|uniref:Probable membrane transporter protein n=1 Tax=Candidatus Anaerobutyricum stercoris TaxID=2838457 RepID=A0A9D2J8D0_9FIRM|nr:sulfite exporter TauE/SafE family protein [Candidatus Anaerobutyricum stercoris]